MESIMDVLPVDERARADLRASLTWQWSDGLGYYHCLRFEQVAEALQYTVDPTLSSLSTAFSATNPGAAHSALAALLKAGCPVLTTNLDILIERACLAQGFRCSVLVSDADYEAYLSDPARFPHALFKLHGTVYRNGELVDTGTTMFDVTTDTVASTSKWQAVDQLLRRHDLLVIGYSGSDDFDVMPAVLAAAITRRLLWLNYRPEARDVWSGRTGAQSVLAHSNQKLAWSLRVAVADRDSDEDGNSAGATILDCDSIKELRDIVTAKGLVVHETLAQESPSERPERSTANHARSGSRFARLMLAGKLLQEIGRFDAALGLLHAALDIQGEQDEIMAARAHLWIAQMCDERSERRNAIRHAERAIAMYMESKRPLAWSELTGILDLARFASNRWAVDSWLFSRQDADGTTELRRRSLGAWLVARRLLASALKALQTGDGKGAAEALTTLHDRTGHFDYELTADVLYWSAILCSLDDSRAGVAALGRQDPATLAQKASQLYEQLQKRSRWADALILLAEQSLPTEADTAYESCFAAAMIADFIGNYETRAQALDRQAVAADLCRRIYGEKCPSGITVEPREELRKKARHARLEYERVSATACCALS